MGWAKFAPLIDIGLTELKKLGKMPVLLVLPVITPLICIVSLEFCKITSNS